MTARTPRILVCEDSRTYAAALTRVLEHGNDFEVVRVSKSAEDAIEALPRVRPDLVTMDIELPGMSGLEAVERIMSVQPVPILVLSSHASARTQNPAAALAAGALDAVAKDDLDLRDPAGPAAQAFRRRLRVLSGARVIRHPRAQLGLQRLYGHGDVRTARAIGICASTGGPQALVRVLGALPRAFPVPVLVVQHISTGFTEGLARWLDATVSIPVRLASSGAVARPGVWVAPDSAHLVFESSGELSLDGITNSGLHRPSGDVLLRSLAANAGKEAVSVVLTGMGRDGAEGSRSVREAGGLTIAQDEASSAIHGMPRAAASLGVDLVLSLDEIGPRLAALSAGEVSA